MTAIILTEAAADSDDVRWCFQQFYDELDRRMAHGFEVGEALPLHADDLTPPRGAALLARLDGAPVGCGAIKLDDPRVAEIKRMWVAMEVRGQGLGGRILASLEARAVAAGKVAARLETNRSLEEAIELYRRRGYVEVPAFNDERHADHWFEKDLTTP